MEFNLSKEDADMISMEIMCEELIEKFKVILRKILRYKQKKPHMKQPFKARKQLLFQILHESNNFYTDLEVNNAY